MVKIGMMIADRYEILEKIGTGGMSDVYKAKCHKLNRFVAVKVLKQEFAENDNFVSKFIIEAQAAAGLMHSNIVNVYDVGEEDGIHYIVMELIEGITLKKYIEKKARLSYKEAVSIAIQVCLGIEAAHNHHIIHRDIKPQNIIISKDGKVKVTDFGIAKAASSNTITSNVMGSVHYTSPEQARGGYSDEKSDVYSLGITLFEMLTGRVPFNGETTVAIAIKHIQEELPSPRDFISEIPVSVDTIVRKCCQKSPDRRYQNMAELVADLKQSLVSPDEDFVVMSSPDLDGGTRAMTEGEMAQVRNRTGVETQETDIMRLRSDLEEYYEEPYPEGDDGYEEEAEVFSMEKLSIVITVLAGVIILIIIAVLGIQLIQKLQASDYPGPSSPIIHDSPEDGSSADSTKDTVYREMPTVVGLQLEDARAKLTALGLYPSVEYQESDTVKEGEVIRADVDAGIMVEEGKVIALTVSSGVRGIEVPDVTNDTLKEANDKLVRKGFLVNKLEDFSNSVEEGRILSQNPVGGTKAPEGSVITVTVSRGEENKKVKVPNLIGMEQTEGTLTAIEHGLSINDVKMVYSDTMEAGLICYQSYSHETYVDQGTAIDISVSLGQERHTYKCNISITAPTVEEAPEFSYGSEVELKLVTDTGQILLDTSTTSFPYAANYYNLDAPGGILTVTYTVVIPGENTQDPETGETVVGPAETKKKSFTRRVDFVRE